MWRKAPLKSRGSSRRRRRRGAYRLAARSGARSCHSPQWSRQNAFTLASSLRSSSLGVARKALSALSQSRRGASQACAEGPDELLVAARPVLEPADGEVAAADRELLADPLQRLQRGHLLLVPPVDPHRPLEVRLDPISLPDHEVLRPLLDL